MPNAESIAALPHNPQVDTVTFDAQLSTLKSDCIALWQNTPEEFPRFERAYTRHEQQETEAKVEAAIIDEKDIEPDSEEAMVRLQRMKSSIRNMVVQSTDSQHRGETDAILSEFSDAGDEFVRQARTFDPELTAEDVFQALRNLWIINSMQVGLGAPVSVTPSGLAYSLLYPYSDNYLDDPSITKEVKRQFSGRFRRRLSGFKDQPLSRLESRIWDLVEMIESEFPRAVFPVVYESLLAIHTGQEKSLRQHDPEARWTQSDLLEISVEKGGTSVLADGYIAKGTLFIDEAELSFGYGVFLQLIDDLQDVEEDLRNGHQTLFTLAASRSTLDAMANRLHRFVDDVLTTCDSRAPRRPEALTELVRRSCRVLILESIARSPGLYSERYARDIEQYSPMGFACIRGLHEKMKAKQIRFRKVFSNKRVLTLAAARI
jgi:hypothetical protein